MASKLAKSPPFFCQFIVASCDTLTDLPQSTVDGVAGNIRHVKSDKIQ